MVAGLVFCPLSCFGVVTVSAALVWAAATKLGAFLVNLTMPEANTRGDYNVGKIEYFPEKMLASVWNIAVKDVEVHYRDDSHDPHKGVRVGEASHPGPRVRKQRPLRGVRLWACNTQGVPGPYHCVQHLTKERLQILALQEASFQPNELTVFEATVAKHDYLAYHSGVLLVQRTFLLDLLLISLVQVMRCRLCG